MTELPYYDQQIEDLKNRVAKLESALKPVSEPVLVEDNSTLDEGEAK